MRSPLLVLAAVVAMLVASAPAHAVDTPSDRTLYDDGHGERYLLDGDWLLRLDPTDQGVAQGFHTQETTEGWSTVSIPNAWNAGDDSAESQRGGIAWYRKDFKLERGKRSGSYLFRFESVNYRATVWLNGELIGTHEGAQVPFELPAESLSRNGGNRLVVRVDSRRSDSDVPPLTESAVTGLPGGGWWNYGGILREVYLRRYDDVDLENLRVRPQLRCRTCDARVLITATLKNDRGGRRKVRVSGRFGGRRWRTRPVSIPSGRTREVSASFTVRNPRLWSPERPSLYDVTARVTRGRSVMSTWETHAGVRSIEVTDNGRVELNGRPITFRGASIHEDHPQIGSALTPRKRRQLIANLLRLNANITRAHYPLHPEFYELADRYGLMIWNQVPVYRMRETLLTSFVRRKGLRLLESMVRRDWNHPSVLTWSIANELSRNVDPNQERYIRDALNRIKRLDPTRLTAIDIAGYPSVRLRSIYRQFDALGINSYFGWYPGPVGSVLNREVLGPYLDQLHDYYRRQALFITEFGAEANRDGPLEEKGTFAFQTQFMKDHLETYDRRPFVNGAIAWILQDFKVRPGWDGYNREPSPPYNKKGLIDENFNRKPVFDDVARMYERAIARGARRGRRGRASGYEDMRMAPIASVTQGEAFQPDRVRLLAIFRTLELGEKALMSGQFRHLENEDADLEPYQDRKVVLEEAPYPHTTWTPVAETFTDQEGYYFFSRDVTLNTRYRVRSADPPQVVSEEPIVRVRLRAELNARPERVRSGRLVTFSGTVSPPHDGMTVFIQRRDDRGRWRNVARTRTRLNESGLAEFSRRVRHRKEGEFSYRVRLAGDADHLPGVSGATDVTVLEPRGSR
ncbi:MAG: glycoside hydrolase family 2 TIM barrel-domain containing protein [Thermoleophilaceae bacterium]